MYASTLPAGAGGQNRTSLESASDRAGPPRRTTSYREPEPDPLEPDEEPEAPPADPAEPLAEPDALPPSPPCERPVVEPAAAPLVELVGGLPDMLSFFATFFLAFFDFEEVDLDVTSCEATVERSLEAWRLNACLSSFARALVASTECVEETELPATVELPLP